MFSLEGEIAIMRGSFIPKIVFQRVLVAVAIEARILASLGIELPISPMHSKTLLKLQPEDKFWWSVY